MEQIKILQLCDAFRPTIDGVVEAVKNYLIELNKLAKCSVAAPKPDKKVPFEEDAGYEVLRCKSTSAPENYRIAHPAADTEFVKKIEAGKFDIFHAHTPFGMGHFAVKQARKLKAPIVATLHTKYYDDVYRVTGSDALSQIYLSYLMEVYKKADRVWTVSETAKQTLKDYGYKGQVDVVRNGTSFTYPDNAQELIDKIDEIHDLKGQENVFLFVGRIAMYKNVGLLVDALKILKDKKVDFKMIFVGGGFDAKTLKAYVKKMNMEKEIIFTGEIADSKLIQGYYLRSDLFLFPSTFDTSGIVKIEAAAHKTPSLLIKDSCSAEQVIDGENGFICEENEISFANKILEIIKDKDNLIRVGENAYKTLYRTWGDVAKEVLEKYKQIIVEYKRKQTILERLKIFRIFKRKAKKKNK